jgi:diguanylate cyclase (GGDEF)-like protein
MVKRERLIGYLVLFFLLVVLFASIGLFFFIRTAQMVRQDAEATLSEVAYQSARHLRSSIHDELKAMEAQALYIATYGDIQNSEIISILQLEAVRRGFIRIGVVLPDGESVNSDGILNNVLHRDYFLKSMKGEIVVSDVLQFAIDGVTPVIVLSVPIFKAGKIVGVLRGTRSVDTYEQLINVSTFGEEGYTYLLKANGQLVLSGDCPEFEPYLSDVAFSENRLAREEPALQELALRMMRYESDIIQIQLGGRDFYLDFRPLGINDWQVVTLVPSKLLLNRVSGLLRLASTVILGMLAAFLAILLYYIITKEKKQETLERIAFVDPLTGLGNLEQIRYQSFHRMRDFRDKGFVFVLIDIDNFKLVNELIGYSKGSLVLKYIATTLKASINSDEHLARVVNDRFALLLRYSNQEEFNQRIQNILVSLEKIHAEPSLLLIEGISIVYSCGIYPIKEENLTFDALLDRANLALSLAKRKRYSSFAYYDAALHMDMHQRKELEDRFASALWHGEFVIHLQPKYRVDTLQLAGAEALVRWQHPNRGLLNPGQFIAYLEENSSIIQLDAYVFEQVCALERRWMDEGHDPFPISVNVSQVHLLSPRLYANYDTIMHSYHIPKNVLELEITETAFSNNPENIHQVVARLRERGLLVSMDDFGTGYSTLNMLKDVEVDIIKIDRKFLQDFEAGGKAETVIRHVLELAADLGITVVAEGVESEAQMDFLKTVNCQLVQGFLFARPMPVEDFEKLLKASVAIPNPTSV